MTKDAVLPFWFPAISRKKITAAFDGGRLTSDGGVMLLAMADRRAGVAAKLSCVFPERRDPARIVHSVADMIRARIFAIACGYEDGNDLDHLRCDPAFKLACGRLPDTERDFVFAADGVSPGECAASARGDPGELCARRSLDGQLRA